MKYFSPAVFVFALVGLASCQLDVIEPVSPRQSASARVAASASADYRGVYVDGFNAILGNSSLEDSLLNWCAGHNFNAISLYDLNTIMGDERYSDLARFIQKARLTYGIGQVAAVRGTSANFTQNAGYDASRGDLNERFTTYNLENEWWNNGPACDFSCYTSILQSMSNKARNASPRITSEAYIGWFLNPSGQDLQQAKTLVRWLDRILVHDYRTYPQFGYMQSRLSYLGRAAQSQNRVIDVIVLFSAEPEFMQDYFSVSGQNHSFDEAYADIVNQFNAASFNGKNNVRLIGYQIFDYSFARQARPTYISLFQ
ncbi:hypothetical protein HNV11_18390 [Spirosoma taeanense]|uniref:Uncharacterized protein n=1 Tax=Spirosoma taeanense TaxID=2735870 RepID=A0A6M5YCA9_9BACT|nr:hypothetical protein [Spirosoma taeanense]QJW91204.1 hypothetical protein HNV11_18390 [Spirosoma taeanense]